jgi:hypothetical protein
MRNSRTHRKRNARKNYSRKRGGDGFLSSIWPFGRKQVQTPGGTNWSTATVNPIKKALNNYPLKRGNGARHLIPIRHETYRGPGILTKRNKATQKTKKGIAFNPSLYVGNFNGPTLPRAVNSSNTRRHFRERKPNVSNAYNNVPNEELWSNPNNWARSQEEIRGNPNDPFHTLEPLNGTPALPYPVDERNLAAFFATAQLYKDSKLSNLSKLNQFAKKNNPRRKTLENTTVQMAMRKLNLRKLAEQAQLEKLARQQAQQQVQQQAQQELNSDIMWSK